MIELIQEHLTVIYTIVAIAGFLTTLMLIVAYKIIDEADEQAARYGGHE